MKRARRDVFEAYSEVIEETPDDHPDPSWSYTDKAGHVHRWHVLDLSGGYVLAAEAYVPGATYEVPTLEVLEEHPGVWDAENEELIPVYYRRCAQCHERIAPGTTGPLFRVYRAGALHYRINGVEVSRREYMHQRMIQEYRLSGARLKRRRP